MKTKNYYSAPKGFNPNPFVKELYHEPDVELANKDDDVIQELIQYAIDLMDAKSDIDKN